MARLSSRRWKRQRERDRLVREQMPELIVPGCALPGHPYWRVHRMRLGLPVPDLPMSARPARFQAEQTDARRARRPKRRKFKVPRW